MNKNTAKMEIQLLRDQQVPPSKEALKDALGKSYSAYEELNNIITTPNFALEMQWNYYKDGKAWLSKVCYKKKTIFWMSVWDNFFKTGFYFTEKNCSGLMELDIDEKIISDFKSRKPIGKLLPLAISVKSKEQIKDVIKIIEYKKKLK
jgi:hypothetical protein